jgi:hypothetical protein
MLETAHELLSHWENFYVIVGSSAAALTGLQFVVIALSSERLQQSTSVGIDTFSTPTVVHFSWVLLLSAILSAPWQGMTPIAALLGSCGAAGLVYTGLVLLRARRQKVYEPVLEDWIFHVMLPLVGYGATLVAACFLSRAAQGALFAIAAAALLLLFVGIHNAWDTATYLVVYAGRSQPEKPPAPPPAASS